MPVASTVIDGQCVCTHSASAHGLRGEPGCSFCSCERLRRPVIQRPKVHLTSYATRALELLVKVKAFQETPREALEMMLAEGHGRMFAAGERLVHNGDSSRVLHVIIDGRAALATPGQTSELGPGDIAGDLRAFTGEPRWAGLSALDTVDALALDTSKLKPVFAEFPELFETIAQVLAMHTDSIDELVEATLSTALEQYPEAQTDRRSGGLDPMKAGRIAARWREMKEMDAAEDRARAAVRDAIRQQTDRGKKR